jgi:hypothetical protein
MSGSAFDKPELRPENKRGFGQSERQGQTESLSAAEVLLEFFKLLEQYAPAWYKEEHHKRAVAALGLSPRSIEPGTFYKGRSQEKKPPLRLQFLLLRSPLK